MKFEPVVSSRIISTYSTFLFSFSEIINSCGGQVLTQIPSTWPPKSIVISCVEDRSVLKKIKGKTTIVSAEWLLSGVLHQELRTEDNLLKF